jgi:hypothetical protein
LVFNFSCFLALSQENLFVIDTPIIAQSYKEVNRVLFLYEEDDNIGKFTSDFINNLSRTFELKGIPSVKLFKTTNFNKTKYIERYDSAIRQLNPDGLIVLRFIDGGLFKFKNQNCLRSFFRFQFEYTYRINDSVPFVQMYMTRIILDQETISDLGIIVSDSVVADLKRRNIFK